MMPLIFTASSFTYLLQRKSILLRLQALYASISILILSCV